MNNKTKNTIGGGAFVGAFVGAILAPVINGSTSQVIFSRWGNFVGFYGVFIGIALGSGICFIWLNMMKR